jgi:hypothetical protein
MLLRRKSPTRTCGLRSAAVESEGGLLPFGKNPVNSILIKAAAWNRPIHLQQAVLAAQIFGFGITSTPVTMILPMEADYFAIRPFAWLVRFSATGGGVVDRKQSPLR